MEAKLEKLEEAEGTGSARSEQGEEASRGRDLAWEEEKEELRKTWEMGRGCVIMKGATLDLHEQRLSTWLQRF